MSKRVFLFLDYDGTLVPIRSTPGKALLAGRTKALLKALADNPRVQVAIVTGRSLRNIVSLVGLEGLVYAGNHGLELQGPGMKYETMAGRGFEKTVARICGRLQEALAPVKGVLVENKGLTLSLHYRLVPAARVPEVRKVFCDVTRPYLRKKMIRVSPGKKVLEVRPAVNWDKGKAVRRILEKFGAAPSDALAVYIGDDVTDESAFKALGKRGLSVFVGESGDTAARYRLKDPRQVASFLNRIKEVCSAR